MAADPDNKKRKVRSIINNADRAELERHYRFVPDQKPQQEQEQQQQPSTWQERMVAAYDEHLYKDYVLADLKYVDQRKLGLRWRTEKEVMEGKGSSSCGNKHCPSHDIEQVTFNHADLAYLSSPMPNTEDEEVDQLRCIDFGHLQSEFEVPFSYTENNEHKTVLVKLRLCARCAPLLFRSRGSSNPSLEARQARSLDARDAPTKQRKSKKHKRIDDKRIREGKRKHKS